MTISKCEYFLGIGRSSDIVFLPDWLCGLHSATDPEAGPHWQYDKHTPKREGHWPIVSNWDWWCGLGERK